MKVNSMSAALNVDGSFAECLLGFGMQVSAKEQPKPPYF